MIAFGRPSAAADTLVFTRIKAYNGIFTSLTSRARRTGAKQTVTAFGGVAYAINSITTATLEALGSDRYVGFAQHGRHQKVIDYVIRTYDCSEAPQL